MHWLTKYTNNPQHSYISHNYPYISSSGLILCHLACHCYLCRDGCVKCSSVVKCALLVCVLRFNKFLLQIFLNFLFLLYTVPPMHLQWMCHPRTCTNKWHPTASTLCPHDRKALELCHSYAQNQVWNAHSQRISWLLVAVLNATLIALQR